MEYIEKVLAKVIFTEEEKKEIETITNRLEQFTKELEMVKGKMEEDEELAMILNCSE